MNIMFAYATLYSYRNRGETKDVKVEPKVEFVTESELVEPQAISKEGSKESLTRLQSYKLDFCSMTSMSTYVGPCPRCTYLWPLFLVVHVHPLKCYLFNSKIIIHA